MKRSTHEGDVLVYKYGCPSWAKLDEAAERQLRLAHELRNALVAIHRAHAETVANIWSEHPEVAVHEEVLKAAEADLEAAIAAGKDERMRTRTTVVSAGTRQTITAARARRKEAKAAHKGAKDAVYDLLAPRFAAAKAEQRAQEKGTYAEFVQGRGLFWATYNDVVAHFATTVASVATKRRAGRPADVRFHRWTGEGTLTIQLQREAGDPVRSPTLLGSGEGKWRNFTRLPLVDPEEWSALTRAEQRARSRATVAIRVGAEGRTPIWCEVPVVWHRPLPADADVTQVQITRRSVAGKARLSVAVTVRTAGAPRTERPGAVALNLGWRSLGEQGIRVAVWDATSAPVHPLVVPPHLVEVIRVTGDGRRGEVVIPASWREAFGRCDALRSRRDATLDALRPQVVGWLREHPAAAEALGAEAAEVVRWRAANRFAGLAHRWRNARQDDDEEIYAALEAWRVHDKHLWSWEANQRDQLIARRTDTYRVLSTLLTSAFGLVVVDDGDLAQVARIPATEDPDEEQARRARGQRVLVSPGLLRSSVVAAAKRRGVPVEHVEAKRITLVHAPCGTDLAGRADFAEQVNVWCPTCGGAFDQDHNAATNLLRRVAGEAA